MEGDLKTKTQRLRAWLSCLQSAICALKQLASELEQVDCPIPVSKHSMVTAIRTCVHTLERETGRVTNTIQAIEGGQYGPID